MKKPYEPDFIIKDADKIYYGDLKPYVNNFKQKYPELYKRIRKRVNKFFNDWAAKEAEIKKAKSLKTKFLALAIAKISHKISIEKWSHNGNISFESFRLVKKSINKFEVMDFTDEMFELPEIIIAAYEGTKVIKAKNVTDLESRIDLITKELVEKNEEISNLKPWADRGKKFTGGKISEETLELYRQIDRKQIELKTKHGEGNISSYKNAVREILKERKMFTSDRAVEKLYKSFYPYRKKHPEKF